MHLGEDCSRKGNKKVIEESTAINISRDQISEIGDICTSTKT